MKQEILDVIEDLVGSFVYYDRKGDSILTAERLNKAVEDGVITIDEMVAKFREGLENTFTRGGKNE